MIIVHIVAYLLIIIFNALSFLLYGSFRAYEISVICELVVYFVCNMIFGLIVN
jgi:hypothetical protein